MNVKYSHTQWYFQFILYKALSWGILKVRPSETFQVACDEKLLNTVKVTSDLGQCMASFAVAASVLKADDTPII